MREFVIITDNGDVITSPMPADETVVEVKMHDGTVRQAWHSCNIMESGDWDFVPIEDSVEPDFDRDSIANQVVAWRYP